MEAQAHQAVQPRAGRMDLVDLARGLAIIGMVVYHFAWDLYYLGFTSTDVMAEPGWVALQRTVLSSFLVLVGASLVLAHRRGLRWPAFWRRFAVLVAAALAVSVSTFLVFPDYFVFFGVLHAIAAFSLLSMPLLRAPLAAVVPIAVLFLVAPAVLVLPAFTDKVFAWIGFWPESPQTTDIVPFFPWFGVLLLGVIGMRLLLGSPLQPALEAWRAGRWSRWLTLAGRYSLPIYLVHQPLLFGALALLSEVQPDGLPSTATRADAFAESCAASCIANGGSETYCGSYCTCALDVIEQEDLWNDIQPAAASPEARQALGAIERLCRAMTE